MRQYIGLGMLLLPVVVICCYQPFILFALGVCAAVGLYSGFALWLITGDE